MYTSSFPFRTCSYPKFSALAKGVWCKARCHACILLPNQHLHRHTFGTLDLLQVSYSTVLEWTALRG